MSARRNRWDACHACRTSFDRIPLAPMLFDGSWRKLAKAAEKKQGERGGANADRAVLGGAAELVTCWSKVQTQGTTL
jgi:hypothetical protein